MSDVEKSEAGEPQRSEGELYIERYYHPHLELPEEMPQKLIDLLEETDSFLSSTPCVYQLMRNGIGNLVFPGPVWDENAVYIAGILQDEQIDHPTWGSNVKDNLSHIFRNAGVLVQLSSEPDKYGRGWVNYKAQFIDLAPEDTVKSIKELIDSTPDYIKRCRELEGLTDLTEQRIRELSSEEKTEFDKKAHSIVEEAKKDLYPLIEKANSEELGDLLTRVISLGEEYGRLTGLPPFLAINTLWGYRYYLPDRAYPILCERLHLSRIDAKIFEQHLKGDSNYFLEAIYFRESFYNGLVKRKD